MYKVIDRVVLICVSTAQLLYSGELLWLFHVGPPAIILYLLAGLASAVFLYTGKLESRILAIVWQGMLMAGTWSKSNDPHDAFMSVLWVAPATIYLGITAILQVRETKAH